MNARSVLMEFVADTEKFYSASLVSSPRVKPDSLKCFWAARDSWIQRGKISELIYFIQTNWKYNNCDPFAGPLEDYLIKTKQTAWFIKLWEPIINGRISYLENSLEKLRVEEPTVDLKEIGSLDTENYDIHSSKARKNLKQLVAFNRKLALSGLHRYFNGLTSLGEIEKAISVDKVFMAVSRFKIQRLS